jgi:GDP-4-dehydro-6-deoxy-D-mannose reductase
MKKILITGITGSGGSYLADFIVENKPEVEVHGVSRWHTATTSKNLKKCKDKVKIHECDLSDLSGIINTLKQSTPDIIFHLASHANVRVSFINPISVVSNNIMGTLNLLEAIRIVGIDPTIQLCSTSEVYGIVDPKNVPINESCPINPANPYAVSKLTQDSLGYVYYKSYGMKVIRTRMFSYINPRRDDIFSTAFANQVARIENGVQKILKHGNLDSVRTMIDVRDAMESYWIAAEMCEPGEVYNIGGNDVITVGQFLDILKTKSKCDIPTEIDSSLIRPVDVTLQVPDSSKFRQKTGWTPKYTLDQSIEFLLNECRQKYSNR